MFVWRAVVLLLRTCCRPSSVCPSNVPPTVSPTVSPTVAPLLPRAAFLLLLSIVSPTLQHVGRAQEAGDTGRRTRSCVDRDARVPEGLLWRSGNREFMPRWVCVCA